MGANFLVAGLGNIGAEYAGTRHNMGFMVLDAWANASDTFFNIDRYGSIAQLRLKGNAVTLLKPSTYMNLSGKAVRYWMEKPLNSSVSLPSKSTPNSLTGQPSLPSLVRSIRARVT